jgi:hypothetical protein
MNESRIRRGAKQNRRDARRAEKRQPTSTDDDILITIRKALAKHPLNLLGMASYLISWATPELHPSTKDTPEEPRSLEGLISHLAERRCRETTALLAVFAELLLDDDVLRERCRRESSTRRDHLPKWIVGLQDVEVSRSCRGPTSSVTVTNWQSVCAWLTRRKSPLAPSSTTTIFRRSRTSPCSRMPSTMRSIAHAKTSIPEPDSST